LSVVEGAQELSVVGSGEFKPKVGFLHGMCPTEFQDPLSIRHEAMTPAKNTAYDEPHTSLIQLLKAVEAAHEIEAAATGRRGTRHGTSDSQRLVAHDHVLVQGRRETHTSVLVELLEAVEVSPTK
jgi:hypothetical protein